MISSQVSEYVQHKYQDALAKSQLDILAKSTLNALKNDVDFPQIKKSIEKNDASLLSHRIEQIASRLVISSTSPWNPKLIPKTERQKLAFNIMRGKTPPLRELLNDVSLLKAILWKPNPELMVEARALVQEMLVDLYRQMSTEPSTDAQNFHAEVILGDLLCLLPFLGPMHGEKIWVPVKIENEWKLVDYAVERIELTPKWMGSPIVAYGLHALGPLASPLLIFKGTTYPTDEGAGLSILTDINPFGSVGAYAFSIGKENIQKWLEKNTADKKALIYGKSLGGAQAWRTALNFPEKVERVMAYGAPGFSPWERRQLHEASKQHPEMELNFMGQTNDPVPYSDLASDQGVNYYEVVGEKIQSNLIAAHADIYSTQTKSFIMRLEPEAIASPWKRAAVTIARLAGSLLFALALAVHAVKTSLDFACRCLKKHVWRKQSAASQVEAALAARSDQV